MPIPPPWPGAFPFSFFAEPGRSVASYFPAVDTRDQRKEDKPANVKSGGKEVEPEDDCFAARLQKQQAKRRREDDMPEDERNSVRRRRSSRSRSPRRGRQDSALSLRTMKHPEHLPSCSASVSRSDCTPSQSSGGTVASSAFFSSPSSFCPPPPFLPPTFLLEEHFRPDVRGIKLPSYEPFLADEPIPLAWSAEYYRTVDSFLRACAPSHLWKTGRNDITPRKHFEVVDLIERSQPAKEAIRQAVGPLGKVEGWSDLPRKLFLRLRAMRDAMQWIWEREIKLEEPGWLILQSSRDKQLLPVHLMIREYASVLRLADAVDFSQRELLAYLSVRPTSTLSAREYRARVLLQWLNAVPQRWYRFFATPDRRIRAGERGEEPWAWWLDGAALEWKVEVLDDWEKGVLEREGWER